MKGPAARFGRSVAVVVGINTYGEGIACLRSAVADATALAEALEGDHGFEVWRLLEEKASLAELRVLLHERLSVLKADDRLLFYFAGHGVALDGVDGPAGYLVPSGASRGAPDQFLPMREVHDALTALPVRHALIILDCCFAGALRWSSLRDVRPSGSTLYRERFEHFVASAAWQVLTSASHDELALDLLADDRGDEGQPHSPFARALLDGLAGAADYTKDNLITADELQIYVRDRTVTMAATTSHRQVPQLFPLARHDAGQFIFQVPGSTLNLPPAPDLDEEANPYLGLRSFTPAHDHLFFGRKDITDQLSEAVAARRLTVVVGPSGSGKSSLVHAGLVPRLVGWHILPSQRPGTDLVSAKAALQAAAEDVARRQLLLLDQLEELFTHRISEEDRAAFLQRLAAALEASPELRVVVTVRSDAEPLFHDTTLGPWWKDGRFPITPMTRDELREVITAPATAKVLHFEPSKLVEQLLDDVALVPSPLPLLSFALSELYRRCWERWKAGDRDRALLASDYREMGSVARALIERANAIYDAMTAEDPAYATTIRNVLLRMVATLGAERVRRRVPLDELIWSDARENQRVTEVLDRLVAARLISRDTETPGDSGTAYAEPNHDELVRGWPKVNEWIDALDEPAGTRALVNAFGSAVRSWLSGGRTEALVWSDPRVELVQAVVEKRPLELNAREAEFLARCQRRRRRRKQLIGAIAVTLTLLTTAAVGLAFRSETASQRANREADRAIANERTARDAAARAEASRLTSEGHRVSAMLEAPGAWLDGIPTALDAMTAALESGTQVPEVLRGALARAAFEAVPTIEIAAKDVTPSLAISGDEQVLVTGDLAGQLQTIRTGTGEIIESAQVDDTFRWVATDQRGEVVVTAGRAGARIWTTHPLVSRCVTKDCDGELLSAQLSADGRKMLTVCTDRSHAVYAVPSCQRLAFFEHARTRRINGVLEDAYFADSPLAATFSPDGSKVAIPSRAHGFEIWSITPTRRVSVNPDVSTARVKAAIYARSAERVLAVRNDYRVAVFAPPARDPLRTQRGGSTALSADGQRLILDGGSGLVQLFELDTGGQSGALASPEISWPAFSDDGQHVMALGGDGLVRVWDAPTRQQIITLRGRSIVVDSAVLSGQASLVATSSRDGTVRIWNIDRLAPTHSGLIEQINSSPDGRLTVALADDGSVTLWDAATEEVRARPSVERRVLESKFSEDGRVLALVAGERLAILDASSGQITALLSDSEPYRESPMFRGVDLSRDGSLAVTSAFNGPPQLWNTKARELAARLEAPGDIARAAFAADGRILLLRRADESKAGDTGSVITWDPTSGATELTLSDNDAPIEEMAVSPERERVVTVHKLGKARRVAWIWRLDGSRVELEEGLGEIRAGSNDATIAFSVDGRRVLAHTTEPDVRVWEAATGRLIAHVRVGAARLNSAALFDGGRWLMTHDSSNVVRIWQVADGQPVASFAGVSHAQISEDGSRLVAAQGRRLRFFSLDDQSLIKRGCELLRGLRSAPLLTTEELAKLRERCARWL